MIIGITGSFGAGKGVVVDYLVKKKGFKHYSARAFIQAEAKKQGLDISKGREVTIPVANALRAQHGATYIIESLYSQALQGGGDAVIESIREVPGVTFIKEHGGVVWGVDAEPKLRYERAFARASETDHVSFEEWLAQEKRESNPDDPTKQDIFGALKVSDVILKNDATLEELFAQIENALQQAQSKL
jgi:dephospho-CoA kinase